ncbi:hypothetical protein EBZ37_15495, partial [bacterium]|nr:hypothetical protein [bacterium]
MLELKDLGELPLRLIFEMVSEVELQAALCFAKGEVLIRPQVARPCSDREVYVLSSLLFKSILRISEELETHQTHFTIVSQNSQPFVALLFRSVLTKWVCLLFLGPLYSPVLLFGPTTWLTGREQEALRSFWSSLNAPLRLSALAFSGLANSLSRLPALMDIG